MWVIATILGMEDGKQAVDILEANQRFFHRITNFEIKKDYLEPYMDGFFHAYQRKKSKAVDIDETRADAVASLL